MVDSERFFCWSCKAVRSRSQVIVHEKDFECKICGSHAVDPEWLIDPHAKKGG